MTRTSTDGECRRAAALSTVRSRRPLEVWSAQLAMLSAMRCRDDRTGTSDDCTPPGEQYSGNAPWLGAAVRRLAERALIVRIGTVRSARPSRKTNEVKLWRLRDDAAAIAGLRRTLNAYRPDPAADTEPGNLFGGLDT